MKQNRHRIAEPGEVDAALRDLDLQPHRVAAAAWPDDLGDLDVAGLYSWWVDEPGARDLADGLRGAVRAGRIYAGQTGATKWPSGKVVTTTLRGRIGSNHLRGRIRGSTFRLTLAAALCRALDLKVEGPKRLSPASEATLSDWMRLRLDVAVHRFRDRDRLGDLEARILTILDPPLNLEGRSRTPLRQRLSASRASLSQPSDAARARQPGPTQGERPMSSARATRSDHVTLHEEIEAILREARGGWMTTQAIADAANRRGRYTKRDGSPITAFQIHGRTRNYSHLFERDGSRVRLRTAAGS